MNVRHGSSRTRILTLTAVAVALSYGANPVVADQGDSLKWTPHRASLPKSAAATESLARTEMEHSPQAPVETTGSDAPPASVVLPDHVPTIEQVQPRPRSAQYQAESRGVRLAPKQPAVSGLSSRVYDPSKPDSLFGVRVMRTPQSPQSQAPRMASAPRASSSAAERLGGGLAPRYNPARPQRPERLAMNADGIPSVMRQPAPGAGGDSAGPSPAADRLPTPAGDIPGEPGEVESIGPGLEVPGDAYGDPMLEGYTGGCAPGEYDGLLMGEYPTEMHVESFYDDPYACDEEENEYFFRHHDGRICRWLRQFGRPYYGWRWYRDFTASAGVTSFTNPTDLGINGNYGTNEYLNFAMPFWNAFGVGWQVGWRGTQTNFQPATLDVGGTTITKNARDQNFLTTGFFTRAFEGRGLQGGIVYDYMHDSWFSNTDLAQLRYEMSYVWGYHEFGFWGASNIADDLGLFGRQSSVPDPLVASTLSLYTGFYRVQFGDANEFKVWGGGTGNQDGIVGAIVRAPMHPSLAVEGTFTYIIPNRDQTVTVGAPGEESTFSPAAWNLSLNLVWYPANRSRRSLASPYRPLFDVADNGNMIRVLEGL